MNICFLAEQFGMGGVEKVNVYLGNYLNKDEKYNIHFFSVKNVPFFYEIQANYEVASGYEEVSVLKKIFKLLETLLTHGRFSPMIYQAKLLNRIVNFIEENRIEILIVNQKALIIFIPFLKNRLPNVKFIAWMHGSYERYHPRENLFGEIYEFILNRHFIHGLKAAHQVVCLTDEELPKFKKHNPETLRIYNPLTLELNGKSPLNHRAIAFVSRIEMHTKGLDYLVKIAKELPKDWKIIYAGNGSQDEEEKFISLIKKFKVEEKFQLLGKVNDQQLKKIYETTSLFLQTSRLEGFGLVLVEAMSFSLPIVAFSQSGSRAITQNGKYGILVENGNTAEMSQQILKLINDKTQRMKWSELASKRVSDFQMEDIAEQWKRLMEKLID